MALFTVRAVRGRVVAIDRGCGRGELPSWSSRSPHSCYC